MREFQKRLTNGFYALLSLPATGMGFALSIQISALSWLLTTRFGLDIHEVGIVWAAGPLAGIVGQVLIGVISDRVWFWGGRRRPFIMIGGALAALMLLALPNIRSISDALGIGNLILVATAVALTLDLAINISFNPTRSVIADVTPEGIARTKGYTWMQTISGFFGVSAYLIGAVAGNDALIVIGAGVVFLFSVVPMLFVSEPRDLGSVVAGGGESAAATHTAGGGRKTDWRQLWKIYGAHALSWVGVQTMFVYIIAFIQQKLPLGADPAREAGQVIAISFAILNTVGFVVPALLLEPLTERFGRNRVHLAAVATMAIGYFGIVMSGSSAIALYAWMAVCGIGWGSIVSLPFAIMTEAIEPSRTGFFMGIFNLSIVIPQLIVSLFLGSVIQGSPDKGIIFIISGSALALSALGWIAVRGRGGLAGPAAPGGGGH